eukprot:10170-Heterococcus_DN1.PRE.1
MKQYCQCKAAIQVGRQTAAVAALGTCHVFTNWLAGYELRISNHGRVPQQLLMQLYAWAIRATCNCEAAARRGGCLTSSFAAAASLCYGSKGLHRVQQTLYAVLYIVIHNTTIYQDPLGLL